MQIHTLIQGTPEWHAYREQCDNASDAPAMMGESPYKKRSDLIREKATGSVSEIDASTQARFDDGKRFEELARPLAEEVIGEDLYPVVGSQGRLSASFDGLTMSHEIAWEHKTLNNDIRAATTGKDLPLHLRIQMEQQLVISGATKCLFTATKWDQSGNLIEKREFWYEPDMELRAKVIAGWEQFAIDVAAYKHVEVLPAVTADAVLALPSLSIRVVGEMSLQSNLPEFGIRLKKFIGDMVTDPQTDQDFANAEKAIKILKEAEDALDAAESAALAQTVSIDEMRKVKQMYFDMARDTRLMTEKLVKARKETIRIGILNGAKEQADLYIINLNQQIGKNYMPAIAHDFPGVMKSKKTISSLRDAVDTELAQFKGRADVEFKKIMFNITTLRELGQEYPFLFADAGQIVLKATDDCTTLIKMRIAEHKEAEAKRLEEQRAKIAEEERIKAEANNAALIKAAAEKLAAEQAAIDRAEAEKEAKAAKLAAEQEAERIALEADKARKDQRMQEEADSLAREQATRAAAAKAPEYTPAASLQQVLTAVAPQMAQTLCPGEVVKFPGSGDPADIVKGETTLFPPKSKMTSKPATERPTDAEILLVLAIHYNITSPQALDLVRGMDIFNSRPAIVLEPVESSQIHAIGHDAVENVLAIQFKNKDGGPGNVYHYKNFTPDQFTEFKNADSIGTHFGKHIKNAADRFPFLKVG